MAYETLLPPDQNQYDPWLEADVRRGDTYDFDNNGPFVRPYIGEDIFYQEDLGVEPETEPEPEEPYDPLTAPFEKVVATEYDSMEAYAATPTMWDRQAEDAYQEQRAHGEALARTIALQSIKRVSEYRANFPKDTDTLQLRLVEPGPSSVDVALAELRQLRDEIAYEKAHPPMFGYAQTLHTKQYETVPPPTDKDAGPAESELVGKSTRTRFEKLKVLSAQGARKFISRITRQAVLWR